MRILKKRDLNNLSNIQYPRLRFIECVCVCVCVCVFEYYLHYYVSINCFIIKNFVAFKGCIEY